MSEFLDKVEMKGYKKGVSDAVKLVKYLIDHDRQDDIKKLSDADYRDKLIDELLLNNH